MGKLVDLAYKVEELENCKIEIENLQTALATGTLPLEEEPTIYVAGCSVAQDVRLDVTIALCSYLLTHVAEEAIKLKEEIRELSNYDI